MYYRFYPYKLKNEDYTIGKVLEYIFFHKLWDIEKPELTFCGFRKKHPHDTSSIMRIAFVEMKTKEDVQNILLQIIQEAINIFEKLKSYFNS